MIDFPPRYIFAFSCAVTELKNLIYALNFEERSNGKSHTEITPEWLLKVIDDFLDNETLYNPQIADLETMREYLQTHIIPIYQQGEIQANRIWQETLFIEQKRLEMFEIQQYQRLAHTLAPYHITLSQRSWFVEGFCKQWSEEWFKYTVISLLKELITPFDFHKSAGTQICTGHSPSKILEKLDLLLADKAKIHAKTVEYLEQIKDDIELRIFPVYRNGQNLAEQTLKENTHYKQITAPQEIHHIARRFIPADLDKNLQSWFLEGFCSYWQIKYNC